MDGWAQPPSQKKRRTKQQDAAAAESSLAAAVFGDEGAPEAASAGAAAAGGKGGRGAATSGGGDAGDDTDAVVVRAAAWTDDDDDLRVDLGSDARLKKLRKKQKDKAVQGGDFEARLRDYHASSSGGAGGWAAKKQDEAPASRLGALASSSARLVDDSGDAAAADRVDIVRCKDANVSEPAKCVIKCVDFDAHSDLMLAGGLDKVLRLYKVDGEENPRAVSVLFKDTPIFCAQFVEKGTVVVSGRRPWYHKYDVDTGATQKVPRQLGARDKSLEKFAASPDGQWLAFTCDGGSVALADARRSQWVQDDLKMSGSARAVAFSSDSRRLYTAGGDAEVYVWDLRSRRCLEKFQDAGASKSSSLACVAAPAHHRLDDSMHRDFLAVGTEAGVVNVYDRGCNDVAPPSLRPAPAMPLRGVMSLTTTVDSVAFSPDGQIAAIASKWSKDALRLVHLPSCRVVANWPTHSTPLHYVTSVAFSKRAGYLAIGNDRGRVLLYKLQQKAGF